MQTTSSSLTLLDDSAFPVVRYAVPEALEIPGDMADPLLADLDVLMERGRSFVLITLGEHDREPAEIRKGRAVWLRGNRDGFAVLCRALIHAEPDRRVWRSMNDQKPGIAQALGMPFYLVETLESAERHAQDLMDPGADARRREIGALLMTFQDRLLARDFEALEGLMTEDFSYVEMDGTALDKAALMARERKGAEGGPQTEISHELLGVEGDDRQAIAQVSLSFRTVVGETVYEGAGRERVDCRNDGDGWRFQRVAITEQALTRNGEAAGGEAIVEMHGGEV